MTLADDYYALLGVPADVDVSHLRRAWRRLALQWHPDRAGDAATATFQRLLAAYTVLADPAARAAYDLRRGGPAPRPTTRRSAPGVMLHRLSGPLNALIACGAARWADDDVLELVVNEREAEEGGMASISLRVQVRCPTCTGTGGECARCGSTRAVDELYSAWLAVPPGVKDGEMLTPSAVLEGLIHPIVFRVRLASARDDG